MRNLDIKDYRKKWHWFFKQKPVIQRSDIVVESEDSSCPNCGDSLTEYFEWDGTHAIFDDSIDEETNQK